MIPRPLATALRAACIVGLMGFEPIPMPSRQDDAYFLLYDKPYTPPMVLETMPCRAGDMVMIKVRRFVDFYVM